MRELFLHVGMHKTGTTSIQQTLDAHATLLQEHGLSWFAADSPNHSRAVFSAFTEAPHRYHMNRRQGLHRPEDAAAFGAASRDALARFLAEAPGPRLVISGESISLLSPEAKQRMLAAFRPALDRITVIGFVRPPRSFIASAIQQHINGGQTLEQIRGAQVAPHYRVRFEPFLSAPEVAETRLQLYTPQALDHGCSVATFLRLIGAPGALYPLLSVVRANPGGSHLSRVLSLAANAAVPVFGPDGSPNPGRASRLTRFLNDLAGPRYRVPERLIAEGLAENAEDIAWMERHLGIVFAEDEKRADPAGAPDSPRPFDAAELGTLVVAVNDMLLQLDEARAARSAMARRTQRLGLGDEPDTVQPGPTVPRDELNVRRAARRAARMQERQSRP